MGRWSRDEVFTGLVLLGVYILWSWLK